jgi:quercetin dioxygenase-like cupin family protein
MTSPLPPLRRVVTYHNDAGKGFVASQDRIAAEMMPHGTGSSVIWATKSHPAPIGDPGDRAKADDIGMVTPGSVARIVDIPPHTKGGLHRTISLDYILVLEGSVTLSLDDESRTVVTKGELVVQQATMHGWDNESDEWARIFCVMLPAENSLIDGVQLEEDLSQL